MDWFKQNFKGALIITLITVLLSLGSNFVFRSCTSQADTVSKSASINYVDDKCMQTKQYIDFQDGAIIQRMDRIQLDVGKKADKDDFDKLWQLTSENNRLLIELAAKQGIR